MLEQFAEFAEGSTGRVVLSVVAGVLFLLLSGIFFKRKKLSVKALSVSSLCIALATILSFVPIMSMPYGGSVTLCSMLFVSLIGYFYGYSIGFTAAITYGVLQFIVGPYVVHPVQLLLDYPVAFGLLGLAGIAYKSKMKFSLQVALFLAFTGRLAASTLSGYIFFAEYTPEGMHPMLYSILYNGQYIYAEYIITCVIVSLPPVAKMLTTVKNRLGTWA